MNQETVVLERDHLLKEYQKSSRNDKADNVAGHIQAPSASGNDRLEIRKHNQQEERANAPGLNAIDECAWYAPPPNDISS